MYIYIYNVYIYNVYIYIIYILIDIGEKQQQQPRFRNVQGKKVLSNRRKRFHQMFVGMIEPITTIAGKMWIGLISTRDNQGSYDRKPRFIQVLRKVGKVFFSIIKSNCGVYSDNKSTYPLVI